MKRPRDYISWSQLTAWEKGKDYYYDLYVLGKSFKNKEMAFGSKIAEGLESGSDDPEVEFCRIYLPEPSKREVEMIVEISKGLKVKIVMDGFTKKKMLVDEYKTGKMKWNQNRADKHGQITLYDLALYEKFGRIPDNRLFWIPTAEDSQGRIVLTGEIPYRFSTQRSLSDLALMHERVAQADKEISNFFKNL